MSHLRTSENPPRTIQKAYPLKGAEDCPNSKEPDSNLKAHPDPLSICPKVHQSMRDV